MKNQTGDLNPETASLNSELKMAKLELDPFLTAADAKIHFGPIMSAEPTPVHPLADMCGNLPHGYDPVADPVTAVPFSREDTSPLTLSPEWVAVLADQVRAIADRLEAARTATSDPVRGEAAMAEHEDRIRIALMMLEDNGRVADRLLSGMFPAWNAQR